MLYTYDLTYTLKMNRNNQKERRRIWDEAHFVSSLQGIVNREKPRLYLYFIGGEDGSIDRFWLDKLREPGEWLAEHSIEEIKNLSELIEIFRDIYLGSLSMMKASLQHQTSPQRLPALKT
ncbi:MAG: hypothetical protein K6T99_02935 [Armatimonadetes bacterium]|nr:hypothetical protein [Armatimonadota bacterium]